MVRIAEHNDWVIITLLICMFTYSLMFISLLRGVRFWDFFMEKFSEASNIFLSWLIVSTVFCVVLSVLVSQYVPIVPKTITDIRFGDFELNKFGYTFLCLSIFYLFKVGLSYIFYAGIGNARKWSRFYFVNTKFYFGFSVALMILCIVHYYFEIDKREAFKIYFYSFSLIFVFKQFFSLFNVNKILPEKWYYKILYICTLQIAPFFALWKLLFFSNF